MSESGSCTRRQALQAIGAFGAMASGSTIAGCANESLDRAAYPVKYSVGTEHASLRVPANATDCHHHIFDSRYPWAPNAALKPADATVEDYRALQRRLGITRHVVIQPSSYGLDNRLLVESLNAFGRKEARGIAVVNTSVTDAELQALHDAGVRGIRFNLAPPGTTTLDMVQPLAARIASRGWHIQVNAPAGALLDAKDVWSNLPVPVVFDHLARVPEPNAINHPTFAMVRELVQRGQAYVKLTGLYNETIVGPPTYSDSVLVAQTYFREAPDRMVWGSDWPHPTELKKGWPNDATLLDLLGQIVPDESARKVILVDTPAHLYDFA
jgi:predicted TIM-barrel fold metal-dependent hydrolase